MEEAPQKFNKRKDGLDAIPHSNFKIHHNAKNLQVARSTLVDMTANKHVTYTPPTCHGWWSTSHGKQD